MRENPQERVVATRKEMIDDWDNGRGGKGLSNVEAFMGIVLVLTALFGLVAGVYDALFACGSERGHRRDRPPAQECSAGEAYIDRVDKVQVVCHNGRWLELDGYYVQPWTDLEDHP